MRSNTLSLFRTSFTKFQARNFEYIAVNEGLLDFKTGSDERKKLEKSLKDYGSKVSDVPICIGDMEIKTDNVKYQKYPFEHNKNVAKFYYADQKLIQKAINTALEARDKWERTSLEERANVFLKAADLISGKYRSDVLATTMLGQAKTIFQAEIDSAAETIDFFRFNVQTAAEVSKFKPLDSPGVVNTLRWRGMEGFWAAITPFNFTAIAGNLATAPAIMGNSVIWKPTDTAMLSNYIIYKILRESGLPAGVINFVPADGPLFGDTICSDPNLAGINFTGSVKTYQTLLKLVGSKISTFKSYPRMIGECGGKNYHFVHTSADLDNVAVSTVRSAFEFGGQKCSACSRLYVPTSKWEELRGKMVAILDQTKVDSPLVKDAFYSAVIDENAFERIKSYIDYGLSNKSSISLEYGGKYDKTRGYFVYPTIFRTQDPHDKLVQEEIFGPVLTVYVYPDAELEQTLELVDKSTSFGLTGAIFGRDENFLKMATDKMKHSAGNFYVNVQSTGSVVGQQPFGGARLSGTNDKAGGPHYILKFASPQSIKTQHGPVPSWKHAHMI